VSKRPKTANAVMSRLRRPAGRLRDLPIWSKLGLIMLVPTLATIIVGTSGLIDHIHEASNAERARTLATLSQASGGLVDQLQNERVYAVTIRRTGGDARKKAIDTYKAEWARVDTAKLPYAQQRAALDNLLNLDKVNTLLVRIDRNLQDLPAIRTQASRVPAQAGQDDLAEIKLPYDRLITDLLTVRDVAAQLADDTTLSDHMRAAAAVARAKDYIAQQREVGHEALGIGDFTVALRREYLLTDTGYALSLQTLDSVGTDSEKQLFNRTVSGPKKQAATDLTVPLINLQGDNTKNIPFTHETWDTAMVGYNTLFRTVEDRLDTGIVAEATDLRDSTNRRVFLETSVLLGMLLLAILFAWLVARSMARSLRELRQGALSVAQFGLPHAVSRLRDPSLHGSLTPAQVADMVAEPLPVRSRDEFGQVTEAFNAVHLEAVRTAAEQAALRSSVATMFVNLARRSQILVDRLIGHLDRLERGEEDPDRLAELFQLDHLATRMRRNDENLLVLAGADSTRVQREPAALIDVLRAAQSEVEHYTRIEFGMIDRDIEVSAHAVNDMVHLVAELFDNATAFSPPNSTVLVEARRLGDGALLSVEDRGIGISREQLRDLNERLANPPMVDVAVSRMMGLVVVARLANRHGVKVELRPADNERGTVADVGLPSAVLVVSSLAGRVQPGLSNFPAADQQQGRPPFPEPLALESGRAGYPGGRAFDPNPPMPSGGMLGTGNGRSVPSWSDLTGAPGNGGFGNGGFSNGGFPDGVNGSSNGANGTNGANGFHGPRSNEVIPPLPQDHRGFSGGDGLPQRNNDETYRPDTDSGFSTPIPRQLPSNPDGRGRNPFVPPVSAPPMPPVSAPPAPYGGGPPVSAPPVYSAPPNSAPPAWPPVSERDAGAPSVPESLAAALDMTAEIPRYRPDRTGAYPQVVRPQQTPEFQQSTPPPSDAQRAAAAAAAAHELAEVQAAEAQATAAAQIAAAQAAAQQRASGDRDTRYADETMELPIFRELESAWFTTAKPGPAPAASAAAAQSTQAPAPEASVTQSPVIEDDDLSPVTTQRFSTGEPARSVGVPQQVESPEPDFAEEPRDRDPATVGAAAANGSSNGNGSPWQTAADEGWQAARLAADAPVDTTTTAGLPKRTPMAQLVPGGVDRGGNSVQRRTPEAVRGLLSAYHRGVQRGRQSTNPDEIPGGQQSSQAGKEHEA
jgi:signal transduction histidine kinase